MWPDTATAPTNAQIAADIALLKEVGANYVRGAHYPQDQRWLDACDEVGLYMWVETLGPDVHTQQLQDPYFLKYQKKQIHEVVDSSVNHPSVILWGFFNEATSSDPLACPGFAESAATFRARDSTRLVTWASNEKTRDACFKHADVLSFNDYPGWYDSRGKVDAPWTIWAENINWATKNFPEKPFTVSETGGGGVWEFKTNASDVFWGLAYQNALVTNDVKWALEEDRVSGISLWHFFDFKVQPPASGCGSQCQYLPVVPQNWSVPHDCAWVDFGCMRPYGENHKGSVDLWRRKKPVFFSVQALYRAVPD
eukprot:NODE_523_length_1391_cov_299.526080_g399_i0.p1 GENE.NODE_523_length_1391_cov_299.526080_g399_i0~~NODE_523_length_1391_cov_299.526080_g399_i0.p1  ORF type:complete len:310 (+),score=69.01 NODE_523_length_1391_cov_299.526080_g399_i0:232-1161(+)